MKQNVWGNFSEYFFMRRRYSPCKRRKLKSFLKKRIHVGADSFQKKIVHMFIICSDREWLCVFFKDSKKIMTQEQEDF